MTAAELDHTPLNRGKHRGLTPDEIAKIDPGWLAWAYETWSDGPCSALLYRECKKDAAEATRGPVGIPGPLGPRCDLYGTNRSKD